MIDAIFLLVLLGGIVLGAICVFAAIGSEKRRDQ
jgi:hypothetical protein